MKSTKFYTSDIEYIVRIYEAGVSLNKVLTEDGSKSDINYYLKRKAFEQPRGKHVTMKPVNLIKNLIITTSNEQDLVLDTFMGSGTTALACLETNRNFIGFEVSPDYWNLSNENIKNKEEELGIKYNL